MKKIILILFTLACMHSSHAFAQTATIKVDILRQVGDIDRNIYGVFMEPIMNTMDGLLYDPDHPLANKDGFRTDYIEAARELELPNMRWPGGNYTLTYDWKDGDYTGLIALQRRYGFVGVKMSGKIGMEHIK